MNVKRLQKDLILYEIIIRPFASEQSLEGQFIDIDGDKF